jgi:hypothetical protein
VLRAQIVAANSERYPKGTQSAVLLMLCYLTLKHSVHIVTTEITYGDQLWIPFARGKKSRGALIHMVMDTTKLNNRIYLLYAYILFYSN